MNILILLLYYNRPKLVLNAINSIKSSSYQNLVLFTHDDNSPNPPIIDIPHIYHKNLDSKKDKIDRGSSLGLHVNKILKDSKEDIAFILCDDDALHPDYLHNLNNYFTKYPDVNSCYSNVLLYNPLMEDYTQGLKRPVNWHYSLNVHNQTIMPANNLDASQVAWRISCNKTCNAWFPEYLHKNHDAAFFKELGSKCGPSHYSGFISQIKGIHPQQLSNISFKKALET